MECRTEGCRNIALNTPEAQFSYCGLKPACDDALKAQIRESERADRIRNVMRARTERAKRTRERVERELPRLATPETLVETLVEAGFAGETIRAWANALHASGVARVVDYIDAVSSEAGFYRSDD